MCSTTRQWGLAVLADCTVLAHRCETNCMRTVHAALSACITPPQHSWPGLPDSRLQEQASRSLMTAHGCFVCRDSAAAVVAAAHVHLRGHEACQTQHWSCAGSPAAGCRARQSARCPLCRRMCSHARPGQVTLCLQNACVQVRTAGMARTCHQHCLVPAQGRAAAAYPALACCWQRSVQQRRCSSLVFA